MDSMLDRKHAINWFLPIFSVLAQYTTVIGLNIGLIILLILSVIDLVKYKTITINKWIVIFIITCILTQLILHRNGKGIITFLIILFSILVLSDKIDENQLYKYFKIFGSIAILGMMYHSVLFYVFGMDSSPIQILPLIGKNADLNWYYGPRPKSFFSEPQAFASYMMPFLFLSLRKNDLKWAIPITLSILLSTSSQGVIMMLILWGGYVLFETKSISMKIGIISIVVSFVLLFIFSPIFEFSRNKILLTEIVGNPRLYRGFEIFSKLTSSEKLIGIGFGDVGSYVYNIKNSFIWGIGNEDVVLLGYTSGMSGTMVQFGLVTTFVLLIMFYNLWKKREALNHMFLFMIFISFFFQNLLLNAWFLYFFLFYIGTCNKDNFQVKSIRFKWKKIIQE